MRVLLGLAALLAVVASWLLTGKESDEPVHQNLSISVEVTDVTEQQLQQRLHILGTVYAERSVTIQSDVDGRLQQVAVKSGEQVAEGQLLFQLDNRQQNAIVERERARLADVERRYRNLQSLLPRGAVTQTEVEAIESELAMQQAELNLAQANLEDREIRAPFAGRLGLIELSPGQLISREQALTTLDDASTLRLNAPIPTRYLSQVVPDKQATLSDASRPDLSIIADLVAIDTRVRDDSLSMHLMFELDNQQQQLPPGSLVSGELKLHSMPSVVIPLQSIVYEGHKRYVYRLNGENVEKVEVELGQRSANQVEVIHGLSQGEQIVIKGMVKLHDGAEVEVIRS
ncbi:efflux RND transporter periplasmic adaptor subunit [Aliagarivorans taiwanensis]|uniref:efflux RND transporter periplasmic adaptor subunit n=1 Tax=Aliagarivorans taiwanensis TaxID=561966 RepID=UPI000407E1F3|nr:efflux RND transporter periplasmic adaptor subunit [Aliagarivorans taiwanensis]